MKEPVSYTHLDVYKRQDAKDVKLLREMMEKGCEMYIQVVPTQQKYEVDKVIDKLDFHE